MCLHPVGGRCTMHMISLWSTLCGKYGETTSITGINMDCCLELGSAITFYFKMNYFLTKEGFLDKMPMIQHKRTFLGKKWHKQKIKKISPLWHQKNVPNQWLTQWSATNKVIIQLKTPRWNPSLLLHVTSTRIFNTLESLLVYWHSTWCNNNEKYSSTTIEVFTRKIIHVHLIAYEEVKIILVNNALFVLHISHCFSTLEESHYLRVYIFTKRALFHMLQITLLLFYIP